MTNYIRVGTLTQIGARNYAKEERQKEDYYATDPKAVEKLLEVETFNKNIWENACGEGNISKVLKQNNYNVYSTDLIDRGYQDKLVDFLLNKGRRNSGNTQNTSCHVLLPANYPT